MEAVANQSVITAALDPVATAQLERLANDPKLLRAQAVLAPFGRGEAQTAVIVTLEPTATAQDLATQSEGSPNRPPSFDQADAPVFYDLQNPTIRTQLRDSVTHAVGQFIAANQQAGLTITQRFSYQFGFAARVSPAALERLLAYPEVLRVEEDGLLEPHLRQGIPLMHADTPSATYDGRGLSIAITDTGIDTAHPRLGSSSGTIFNSKVIGGYDTGDNDADPRPGSAGNAHGTACAGIAAGDLGDSGDYIGGVAPGARLYAIKISYGTGGSAFDSAMIAGWEWAITHQYDDPNNPILVISTSFGGGDYAATCDTAVPNMTTAAANAVAAGISIFASSGNDGYCASMGWPACISYVNSVGAVYDANFGAYYPCVSSSSCAAKIATTGCTTGYYVNDSTAPDKVTAYSNSASFLTLLAPSNQAYTTDIVGSGGYATGDYNSGFGGTSAACPYAAGAAAVLQSAAKAKSGSFLTSAEVKSYLTSYGTTITDGKVTSVKKPRIDLASAVNALPVAQPTVSVSASDPTAAEADLSTGSFTFSRTGDTSAALTVNYTVTGTATAGSDYTALGASVNFAAGASTVTKTVTPLQDTLIEADETVILTLIAGSGYTVGTPASATVTISSDDTNTVTVNATDASASEAGLDTGTFTFSRTGDTSAALTVNYTVTGTATPDSDYVALGTSVTFAAGSSTATKTLTPLQDTLVEAEETVILTLNSGSGYSLGTPASATVTIASDDGSGSTTVTVAATDATATEAGLDTGTFTFSRSGDTSAALTVNYTVSGTATAASDYIPLGTSVTFAAGASTATQTVTPIQDTLVEPDETVILTLAAGSGYILGTPASGTVTIKDAQAISVNRRIAGGGYHSLFIASDGSLWAWGFNGGGQLGDGSRTNSSLPKQILTDVVAVAAGGVHSLALKTDGSLWAWGDNYYGQLGDGTTTTRTTPKQIMTGVAAVAAGWAHSLALKTDGTLWAWGSNSNGQLGDGTTMNRATPKQIMTGVAALAAGDSHSLALKTDGSLWAWGYNAYGQLGDGTTTNSSAPKLILTGVAAMAAGSYHSLALMTDGSLWAWGQNWVGQLGDGTYTNSLTPKRILTGVAAVAAGYQHSLALKTDGSLWAWGDGHLGQLGDGTDGGTYQPEQILTGVAALTAGYYYSLALKSDGSLWAWGSNVYGQLGDGTTTDRLSPVRVGPNFVTVTATDFDASEGGVDTGTFSFTRTGDNSAALTVYYSVTGTATAGSDYIPLGTSITFPAGASTAIQTVASLQDTLIEADETVILTLNAGSGYNLGIPSSATVTIHDVQAIPNHTRIAGGFSHSLFIADDGSLWAWGYNAYGQLGDGTTTNRITPKQITTGVVAVAAGNLHSLALKTDGSLWAWGYNFYGQLGDGTTTNSLSPKQISLTGIVAVAAGDWHSLALKSDGSLWAWGANGSGQLGDETTTASSTPKQILTGVVAIAAGSSHTLALKTDGSLWAWGYNFYGQLGDGTTTNTNLPKQILTGVTTVASGVYHTLALKSDGSLWAWGRNEYGQLGDETTTNSLTPKQVLADVAAVGAGYGHTLALKTEGSLWVWGYNGYGQLGDGTYTNTLTPKQISLTGIVAVAAGSYHSLALKNDGSLWAWGENYYGKLGDGTTTNRLSPVQVSFNFTVTASGGTGGSISPTSTTVAYGATTTFTVLPNTGYTATVSGCGGTLSGTTYTTGTITGACTVNATFTLKSYTVTATAGAGGTISPSSQTVNHGATTAFTVTPNTGYTATVSGCGGTLSGTTYTTGTITGACTVNATFTLTSVTVSATDDNATEAGLTTGTFTFSRTGDTSPALTVNYTVSGTATAGSDYEALGTSFTIAAGATSATLTVTPLQDSLVEADETIVLTLATGSGYTIGTPSSATVTLSSDDAPDYTLTVTRAGTGTGKVTSSPAGIDCGIDCSHSYASGTRIVLTASPSAGSDFAGWSGSSLGLATNCAIYLDEVKEVTASFTQRQNHSPTFEMGDGQVLTPIRSSASINDLALQPDGKIVAVGYSQNYNGGPSDLTLARYNADGSLDNTFGTNGILITPLTEYSDQGFSVVVQPDGKIVIGGYGGRSYTNSDPLDFALVRYESDGSLDTSFATDGVVLLPPLAGANKWGFDLALQPDGNILFGGTQLVRFLSDGSLDTTFGNNGQLAPVVDGLRTKIAIQPDGKILVGGDDGRDFAIERYNRDGSLDTSFGTAGKLTLDFHGYLDILGDIALQEDGKILLAGFSTDADDNLDFALIRLNSDGGLDTGFGTGGLVTTNLGALQAQGRSIALQSDGKILVGGSWGGVSESVFTYKFALVRYTSNGSLDTTFGMGGKVTTTVGDGTFSSGYSIALQPDGKILFGGSAFNNSPGQFALVRYTSNGSLDRGFDDIKNNTLGGTAKFNEGGLPVVLDNDVRVYDADLSALGNYDGATLTLARNGGANTQDLFSAKAGGTLGSLIQGADLVVDGNAIGTITQNSAGILLLSFNGSATQDLVDGVLQQLAYANSSSPPPSTVQIDWHFSDGNAGLQGAGGALSTHGFTTVAITAKPSVTVTASDDSASEADLTTGTFTFSRAGDTSAALTVNYTVTGTATSGSDYTSLGTSVSFAAGASTATLTVTPLQDTLIEADETVILTLASGTGYTLGTPSSATVTITSDDTNIVTVAATDDTATEADLTTGTFTFSRTGDTSAALTVNYTVTGTATSGSDYTSLGTSVSFAAGASTTTLTVTPLQDTLIEADETVILTLASGTGYTLGTPSSATVTLTSDDINTYTVMASAGTGGSISPTTVQVAHGTTTSFTVTPNTGYSLGTVSGCGGSLSGTTYTTGAITAPCTVSASFIQNSYTVTASANPTAGGTVSCSPSSVLHGGSSQCTATIANGYGFVNWGGHCTGTSLSCTLTNITGARSVTANFMTLSGILDATHSAPSYRAGSTLTVTASLNDLSGATPWSLLWRPILPSGWTLTSVSGDGSPELSPDGSEILFLSSLTGMPIDFSYQVAVPAAAAGHQTISAAVEYQNSAMANPVTLTAAPNPLDLAQISYHSADYRDARWQIDSSEASRVLAYWRATAYHPDATGVDGYVPGSGSNNGSRHTADYRSPYWQIDGSEANRVLAYWRATAYHVDAAGVDGYAPGVPVAGAQAAGRLAVSTIAEASAAHSAPAYQPGGTLTLTNRFDWPAEGTLLSLLWEPSLPAGWTISAVSGDGGPELGPDGKSILFLGNLTANPLQFTYQVSVPAGTTGPQNLNALVEYQMAGAVNAQTLSAQPSPLVVDLDAGGNLTITGADVPDSGVKTINASGEITVLGDVIVRNGVQLILNAGNRITFLPEFKVNAGGRLSAGIGPGP